MSKVALAAAFRHRPEQDGSLIPASRIEKAGVFRGHMVPFIGYLVAVQDGCRPFWSFVKYEALELPSGHRPLRPANFGTCRVEWVKCPECGANAPFPAGGKNDRLKGKCPFCGSFAATHSPVKEGSEQFRRMLGDLEDPLLQEANALLQGADAAEDCGSPFPRLLVGAPDGSMEPDPEVPPAVQGLAQAKGRVFRLMSGMTAQSLPVGAGRLDYSIVPEIRTALVEADEARDGWTRQDGLLTQYIRLSLPRHAPEECGVVEARY